MKQLFLVACLALFVTSPKASATIILDKDAKVILKEGPELRTPSLEDMKRVSGLGEGQSFDPLKTDVDSVEGEAAFRKQVKALIQEGLKPSAYFQAAACTARKEHVEPLRKLEGIAKEEELRVRVDEEATQAAIAKLEPNQTPEAGAAAAKLMVDTMLKTGSREFKLGWSARQKRWAVVEATPTEAPLPSHRVSQNRNNGTQGSVLGNFYKPGASAADVDDRSKYTKDRE